MLHFPHLCIEREHQAASAEWAVMKQIWKGITDRGEDVNVWRGAARGAKTWAALAD